MNFFPNNKYGYRKVIMNHFGLNIDLFKIWLCFQIFQFDYFDLVNNTFAFKNQTNCLL